jgi:hypothetical protein
MTLSLPIGELEIPVKGTLRAGLVPFIKGSPGLGKTSLTRAIAKKANLKYIDIRLASCDPTDMTGFPQIDGVRCKSHYIPFDTFPLEDDPIPDGYDGWMIGWDEFNGGFAAVQKASYKILLEKEVGLFKLHPMVRQVCMGNLDTDKAMTEELSTALQSRLIHFRCHSDLAGFLKWATAADLTHHIGSFLNYKPELLNNFDPEKETEEDTYSCERTWEFAHKQITDSGVDIDSKYMLYMLGGALGEGVAREFVAFLKIFDKLPTIAQIVANPTGTTVPSEAGTLYGLTGFLGHAVAKDPSIVKEAMEYIARFDMDYQVVTLKDMMGRNAELFETESVADWVAVNRDELF